MDQYFTTNELLLSDINNLININNRKVKNVLEPSCGTLNIIEYLLKHNNSSAIQQNAANVTAIEIDKRISVPKWFKGMFIYGDFLTIDFNDLKFDLIVGNPPFSLTSEFIDKCLDLLNDNGQFIFIVPENTFKLTSNINLLRKMDNLGIITHYYKYNDERMFAGASVSVIVFSFTKTKVLTAATVAATVANRTIHQHLMKYKVDSMPEIDKLYEINPLLMFVNSTVDNVKFNELFNVYVGFVSGADSILKTTATTAITRTKRLTTTTAINTLTQDNSNSTNTMQSQTQPTIGILKSENVVEYFLDYTNAADAESDPYMMQNKQSLINRKIGNFNESNWFVYGLKRNESTIRSNLNKPCIYVYCQSRKNIIAFVGTVNYFGSNLLCCIPKNDNVMMKLHDICLYLNSNEFKQDHITSNNKFTITHKQLAESYINVDLTTEFSTTVRQQQQPIQPQLSSQPMNEEIEHILLTDIVEYLQQHINNHNINLLPGRENEKTNELKIIQTLKEWNEYNIWTYREKIDNNTEDRHWFDFAVLIDNTFVPVNIKTTQGNSADNSGSLIPLLYALTNYKFEFDKSYKSGQMIKYFNINNIDNNNNRDYWYLVINTKTNKVFANSIKGLQHYTINLSNMPFQINWSYNSTYEPKTSVETFNTYIMKLSDKCLENSIHKHSTWQNILCNMSVELINRQQHNNTKQQLIQFIADNNISNELLKEIIDEIVGI